MNSLEIFSGAGGLATGLSKLKIKHKAFIEFNKDACNTLRSNYKSSLVQEIDIRNVSFNDYSNIDLIAGGPPCQPFSLGGKHKANCDDRDMFPYAINAIRDLMPKVFIFENVKGLLRKNFSTYFNYIILQLTHPSLKKKKNEDWIRHLSRLEKYHLSNKTSGVEYKVIYRLLNAADYGIPQIRERVFMVGVRSDININWSFPEQTHSMETLLYDKYVINEYWDRHEIVDNKTIKNNMPSKSIINNIHQRYSLFKPTLKPWKTVRDAICDLPDPIINNEHSEHIYRPGAKSYPGHTGSDFDSPSKTLKAGAHGVPGGENMIRFPDNSIRYLTVLEAKRIQTFPDYYKVLGSWTEAMRQLGNAVPVELATYIFSDLLRSIKNEKKQAIA